MNLYDTINGDFSNTLKHLKDSNVNGTLKWIKNTRNVDERRQIWKIIDAENSRLQGKLPPHFDSKILSKKLGYFKDNWIHLRTQNKLEIMDWLCNNTRFYYIDDKYYDDVGTLPYSTFRIFHSVCRRIRWLSNNDTMININYLLGIKGVEGGNKGYSWTNYFTKNKIVNISNQTYEEMIDNWRWNP